MYGAENVLGGILIGAAAALLYARLGHVLGVSGILGGLIQGRGDRVYRVVFVGTLIAFGLALSLVSPARLGPSTASVPQLVVAGLLVGFGTRLANGCTSGHGVCGIARFSPRSLLASATFVGSAMVTLILVRALGGTP